MFYRRRNSFYVRCTLFPGRSTQALEIVGAQEGVCCELTIDVVQYAHTKGEEGGRMRRVRERERARKKGCLMYLVQLVLLYSFLHFIS